MNAKPFEFVAKHKVPFLVAGGAVVVLLIFKNMSNASAQQVSSTPTTSTPATSTPDPIAVLNAQTNAQLALQQDKEAFSLAYLTQQGGVQTAQQSTQVNAQLEMAKINAQNAHEQIASQLALGQAETQANVQIQNIIAGENLGIAQVNGQTQQVISTNNANVNIAQTQAMAAVGQANANAAASQGGNSIGGILGGVSSIIGSLF